MEFDAQFTSAYSNDRYAMTQARSGPKWQKQNYQNNVKVKKKTHSFIGRQSRKRMINPLFVKCLRSLLGASLNSIF